MYQNQVGEAKLNKWEDNIYDEFTIIQNIALKISDPQQIHGLPVLWLARCMHNKLSYSLIIK